MEIRVPAAWSSVSLGPADGEDVLDDSAVRRPRHGGERVRGIAERRVIRRRLARHRRFDHRLETTRLVLLELLVAFQELGQHLSAEQLEALHDVLVAVVARLAAEDHLVDTRFLVAREVVADLVGRADRAAEAEEALLLHDLRAQAVTPGEAASTASGA